MPILLIAFVIIGFFDIYLSFIGWQAAIGTFWTIIIMAVSGFCRTSIIVMIGAYLGAVNVLGWPWWGGVLIAAPGLLLILPQMIGELLNKLR